MKFKDAYEHYQNGTASDEEKQFVEEHMEEFQILLDASLKEESMNKEDINVYNDVKRIIRKRRIRFVVTLIILIAVILSGMKLWKIYTVYNIRAIDETAEKNATSIYSNIQVIESELYNPEYHQSALHFRDTPKGTYNYSFSNKPVIDINNNDYFGTYDYQYEFKKTSLNGPGYSVSANSMLGYDMNHSYVMVNDHLTKNQNPIDLSIIESYPVKTKFAIFVKMDEEMSIDQVLEMEKTYKKQGVEMGVSWMPIYYNERSENEEYFPVSLGFDFYNYDVYSEITGYDSEKYPYLSIQQDQFGEDGQQQYVAETGEMYLQHVNSMLTYLMDHKDVLNTFGYRVSEIELAQEIVQKQGLRSDALFLVAEREDLLEVLKNEHFISGHIVDVKQQLF